ncbi:MoxR-like ATPase [Acetitomaculum ruminis DSM 5522]|uniref:MoxR-like ATPase n=1 Tax=Acetitomaculum ruminis DSM 5522 TaxID=1120918 RepID=A0A1I0Z7Z4_9FIRM|nr:MoxR family ATPase [Acetitomaculum ruminis]SFB20373.1 MoxR-like ATPase [Acetitomaculum ruminis DSM 5522]
MEFLREQGVNENLIQKVIEFREKYQVFESEKSRIEKPQMNFYGKEILEMAISAILEGENILLCGAKATGKNVLAENLAYIFGRPQYNISFHVNIDSNVLIGTDTFEDNKVKLRKGPVYLSALYGGFCILDEINMAKNDAVSVLHSVLDHRKIIDVPGYDKIHLNDACRFIGTMNYGYVGTRELNEALVSRFMVIDMPSIKEETLMQIFENEFPDAKKEALLQFTKLFMDLQKKAENGEISTKPLDLRGIIAALRTIRCGLKPVSAVSMGITNKSFDGFERDIVGDVVMTRIPDSMECFDVF